MMIDKLIAVRGGGDVASGIIYRLHKAGFKIVVFEIEKPTVIRRKVAFAQTIYTNETKIEDIKAKRVKTLKDAYKCLEDSIIPVIVDPKGELITKENFFLVIDAILAKKNLGTNKDMAEYTIGAGPGFMAGRDVDAVIETNRGHKLGRVFYNGKTDANTGIPGNINGFTKERVIRANNNGKIKVIKDIGSFVKKDETIAIIDDIEVKAKIKGVIRGMIKNDFYVYKGMKIGDVDPRGVKEYCYKISGKALAVGGGALEAVCKFVSEKKNEAL
ncbi:MAG: EF2563 family selenium-dependent molybdenum hydroxylase system protein [Firmicutes bacterium]|nr:EF2563 family selenium-dependent molybdenum hydroxylase system protein [Bacillota bacterium]